MPIHTLILSGGAMNGINLLGFLKKLSTEYDLKKINKFIGVSCGSIISFIINCGIDIEKFSCILIECNILEKLDLDISLVYNDFGLSNFKKSRKFYEKIFEYFNISKNITFLDLYNKTKKHLIIPSLNLSKQRIVYFDYLNYPNLEILEAIHMSINIPLLFTKKIFNDEYYIDGAFANTIPIEIVKEEELLNTVCISILTKNNISQNNSINIIEYLLKITTCMIHLTNNIDYKYEYFKQHIFFLDCRQFKSLDFSVSKKQKLRMYLHGIQQCTKLIENNLQFQNKIKDHSHFNYVSKPERRHSF